jgi:hypothetical protein
MQEKAYRHLDGLTITSAWLAAVPQLVKKISKL